MKGKKNLEKAIVMGLMLSSISVPVWAENLINENILANNSGNPVGLNIENKNYETIKLHMVGFEDVGRRTTLLFGRNGVDFKSVGGKEITIINSVDNNYFLGNNDAVHAMGGSTITLNADKVFIAAVGSNGNQDSALVAKNTINSNWGTNKVDVSGKVVQIIGNMDMASDDKPGVDNTIKVTLSSADSFWYGDERNYKGVPFLEEWFGGGVLDVALSNGAQWIYNAESSISALTLNENGIVNLQDDEIKQKYETWDITDYRETDPHKIVEIRELKGNGGIFKVDLDFLENGGEKLTAEDYDSWDGLNPNSDYIYIENSAESSMQTLDFDVSKANLEKMNVGDKLYFANVADGNTAFTTTKGENAVYSSASNIYNYQYGVGSDAEDDGTNADWYIGLTGKTVEGNANYESAKGAMYAGYALGTELDTLNKRMGEARYLEDDNGVWVRYRHAKTGWDDTFETNSDMFQLGFDKQVQEDDGTHYRGVAVDYTDADTSLMHASGDGENKRYAVSLYDTWIGEKGHYRDLVLRGGRINSDYDISGMFDNGMADIGGDYHQWFGSISAEWGRKNDMQSGWYFEPQVQAQLARIGGASYVSDSGVDVDQDGATSLIGRAGFRIGREYEKDNGKTDNYYFKADLMHEFMGDKGIALSTVTERYTDEYDGQETWCDVGIGADISLGKNSYFWADVERTFGADFDNTWQINGGFRWEF